MTVSPPTRLRDRPTADLIVVFLALLVGVIVLVSIVGAVVWKINDPSADLTDLVARIGDITNTLIGAVVGYLAGRGAAAAVKPEPTGRRKGGVSSGP